MSIEDACDQLLDALRPQETQGPPADRPPTSGAAAPPPSDCPESEPFDWLISMIRQAMQALMTPEIPPLQRANAIARLGGLYLRAARAAELQRANKALQARVAELEQRLTSIEASARDSADQIERVAADQPAAGVKPTETQPMSEPTASSPPPHPGALAAPPARNQTTVAAHAEHPPCAAAVRPAGAPAVAFAPARGSP